MRVQLQRAKHATQDSAPLIGYRSAHQLYKKHCVSRSNFDSLLWSANYLSYPVPLPAREGLGVRFFAQFATPAVMVFPSSCLSEQRERMERSASLRMTAMPALQMRTLRLDAISEMPG